MAVVLAGGEGQRLYPLTKGRAKAAVPFGGKYRIIDFTLSNCINSDIRQIFVLTQYRSGSLNQHIQEGWGISSSRLGEYVYCVPAQQKLGRDWYRGTADALRQNLDLMKKRRIEQVLILAGDHIYKMDYTQMVKHHKANKADVTIATIRARREAAAGALGVLEADGDNIMRSFEEKPRNPVAIQGEPDYCFASMGVYVFDTETLIESLQEPHDDFGKGVIPQLLGSGKKICVYDYERQNCIKDMVVEVRDGIRQRTLADRTRDSSYWRDVGSVDSYYEASMDLVGIDPVFNLYGNRWPFRTYQRLLPPTKFVLGGAAVDSIVSEGCIVSGAYVRRSILSPGVVVERDSLLEESIVFDDVTIEPRTRIRKAIIDKEVVIEAGATIGYDPEADRRHGCTVSDGGVVVVPREARIAADQ